ncbi:MAG TPA: SufD family Fe-S cluster assembly protein [Steroidobacteraceae bacterium]|nr:SufD family Fe-S cluster assembly protein [Steroidobacteraceae bacterium]
MSALERILSEFGSAAATAPARLAAAESLRAHGLPTRRDENWRYANLRSLEAVRSFLPAPEPTVSPALPPALPGFSRLVFIDGHPQAEYSLPDAALLASLRGGVARARATAPLPLAAAGDGRLGLIARMFAPDPLTLHVSGRLALELVLIATGSAGGNYLDLEVQLAAGAQLDLVERHLGSAGPTAMSCVQLDLRLAEHSQLTHTRLLQCAPDALYYDTLAVTVAADGDYRLRQVAAGGQTTRSTAEVRLSGRDARVQIRALATAHGPQVCDALFTVLHEAPGTRSDQLFRGIASERAHVACSADVQVAPSAKGARVLQSLRGLIDGAGAEVDLRPRLTINTDEVQAAHGATTGRLDEDLLFYLLSRGLSPGDARSLLKWAFLAEALNAIDLPPLRRDAGLAAAARLADIPATELLQ